MSTMVTIIRKTVGSKYAYLMSGTVNGEAYADEPVIKASKVSYSHAALTRVPSEEPSDEDGTREVLSFHKSAAAAAKGNSDLRRYAVSVRVIEIESE